jgi:hypothetical protein
MAVAAKKTIRMEPAREPVSCGETRIPGTAIVTRWELVTPEMAAEYLEHNDRNRRYMPSYKERLQADMNSGQWFVTHQGAAFLDTGSLADAQHRLRAIADSGQPQWMLVTRGLPQASMEAVDRGRLRSMAHVLQLMGYSSFSNNRHVACARMMMMAPAGPYAGGLKVADVTDITLRKFMEDHQEALLAGVSIAGGEAAPLSAALARAYYYHPPAELARFMVALRDQVAEGDERRCDKTARRLGDLIKGPQLGGATARFALYRKVQNALAAWLAGKELGKLYESNEDLFPLPDPGARALAPDTLDDPGSILQGE